MSKRKKLSPRVVPLWDKRQAAKFLGVSVRTVERLVAYRRVPFLKIGRLVRFQRDRLEQMAQRRTVEAF